MPLLSSVAPAYPWAGLTTPQDLQDPMARLQVIRAMWPVIDLRDLIGGPWPVHGKVLDDKIAGRVLAEMVRQIGPDGPTSFFPSLLGPWEAWGTAGVRVGYERYVRRPILGPCAGLLRDVQRSANSTARRAMLAQDDQDRPRGAILWEQVAG